MKVHNRLGFLRAEQRKFDLAIVQFQESLKLNGKQPAILNSLAVAYFAAKNYSEAVKTSEKALALARAKGDQALITKLQKQLYLIKRASAESK